MLLCGGRWFTSKLVNDNNHNDYDHLVGIFLFLFLILKHFHQFQLEWHRRSVTLIALLAILHHYQIHPFICHIQEHTIQAMAINRFNMDTIVTYLQVNLIALPIQISENNHININHRFAQARQAQMC